MVAPLTEVAHGVVGIDAVGPPAARDDVAPLGELIGEPVEAFEFVGGDVHGAGEVPGGVLGFGEDVEDEHLVAGIHSVV